MIGQFIFSTCRAAGLEVKAYLKNTRRSHEECSITQRKNGIEVQLLIFEEGNLKFKSDHFGNVGMGEALEISKYTCPILDSSKNELLIAARCKIGENHHYFSQEHQLVYSDPQSGVSSSLLYDQLPLLDSKKVCPPIVLVAPKIWVSETLNTYVVFANHAEQVGTQAPLTLTLLNPQGKPLWQNTYLEKFNSTLVVDVKSVLPSSIRLSDKPLFLNLVAKGGSSTHAILTFIRNSKAGTFALEHSLSPHYYVSGDRTRIRKEALDFPWKRAP